MHAHLVRYPVSAYTQCVAHAWSWMFQGAAEVGFAHWSGRTVAASTVEAVGISVVAFQWHRADALAPRQMPDHPNCSARTLLERCCIGLAR